MVSLYWAKGLDSREYVLTICNTLEVVVGLNRVQIDTNPLKVNFVLDITKQDEGGNNTSAPRALDPGLDIAIPHVGRGGQHSADRLGRHGQQGMAVVQEGLSLANPVHLARVAKVFADVLVPVERVHLVGFVLAYWRRDAGVDGEGHARVAAAETECANAALVVFCDASFRRQCLVTLGLDLGCGSETLGTLTAPSPTLNKQNEQAERAANQEPKKLQTRRTAWDVLTYESSRVLPRGTSCPDCRREDQQPKRWLRREGPRPTATKIGAWFVVLVLFSFLLLFSNNSGGSESDARVSVAKRCGRM